MKKMVKREECAYYYSDTDGSKGVCLYVDDTNGSFWGRSRECDSEKCPHFTSKLEVRELRFEDPLKVFKFMKSRRTEMIELDEWEEKK